MRATPVSSASPRAADRRRGGARAAARTLAALAAIALGATGVISATGATGATGAYEGPGGSTHPLGQAAAAGTPPLTPPPLTLTEVAPGVLVHLGQVALNSPANRGDIANLGAIIGERCVAIIDTGGSPAIGAALRRAVTARTRVPICHVITTHGHPDHVMGNVAFADDRPAFIGHARLASALAHRGATYQRAVRTELGDGVGEPVLVPPTRTVDDRLELDLGGRRLAVQAWPAAHTDQDLTVTDLATGVIFVGDLVFDSHLPVLDGNLKGWLTSLERLQALPARLAIPGHGQPAELVALLGPQRAYLEDLRTRVSAAIAGRQAMAPTVEALGKAAGPAESTVPWRLVEQFHRRNVTTAYAELEWD